MQHDEVIWHVIRHYHCSFMHGEFSSRLETGIFCRNPYNVTGICNRSSCPLANSRYATIRDHNGVFYLYMKTIERAAQPKKLWQRIKLPRNYEKAMEVIDKNLMYWPKLLVHKIKQRLTVMTQMRIRLRKLSLKTRENSDGAQQWAKDDLRGKKAEIAAKLDKAIEKELLERLKEDMYPRKDVEIIVEGEEEEEKPIKGGYGGIYNHSFKTYERILEMGATAEQEEEEYSEELEYVEECDMEDFGCAAVGKAQNKNCDEAEEQGGIGRKRVRGGSQPEVWRGDMIEKDIDEPAAGGAGKKWIMRKSRVDS